MHETYSTDPLLKADSTKLQFVATPYPLYYLFLISVLRPGLLLVEVGSSTTYCQEMGLWVLTKAIHSDYSQGRRDGLTIHRNTGHIRQERFYLSSPRNIHHKIAITSALI